jgi:hypothetical protein
LFVSYEKILSCPLAVATSFDDKVINVFYMLMDVRRRSFKGVLIFYKTIRLSPAPKPSAPTNPAQLPPLICPPAL